MLRSKFLSIFMVLLSLLVTVITGCQPKFQSGTYTDDMGQSVSIDKIPERIVSFGPSITEILFALGLGEKVVGIDSYSDYPEEAKSKPKIGDAFSPSMEKIAELAPDLVLTLKHKQLNTELDARGVKFVVIDPKDIDGILKDIELLGKVTGAEARARGVVNEMRQDISRVLNLVKNAPRVKVIYIIDTTDLNNPWTAGPGSFIDSLITTAGGENIAAKAPSAWVQFSIEEVVSSDPEVIILPAKHGTAFTSTEVFQSHSAWRETTAVKQGRVYLIDGDIVNRPGPRIVRGLEEMAKMIHPELFK